MCIAAWIWQVHPLYPIILLLNRDEYHDRPTKCLSWWGDGEDDILGGVDVLLGGTWLGCTREGKLAFLTNVLEPDTQPTTRTRGDLTVKFLKSRKNPVEFAEETAKEAKNYKGFNLVLADIPMGLMVYVSNRPKQEFNCSFQVVPPGLHVLTNAQLDTPWPKAQRLAKSFRNLILKPGNKGISQSEMVEKLMEDTTKADRDKLPNTGVDSEMELQLSSIFVDFYAKRGHFGTRSTAAILVDKNYQVSFYEKYLENGVWKEHILKYAIEHPYAN